MKRHLAMLFVLCTVSAGLLLAQTTPSAVEEAVVKADKALGTAYAKGDPCLHDPCVVGWLLAPDLFSGVDAFVEIDCLPGLNYGRTVVSVIERHMAGRSPNCKVITAADCDGFFDLLGSLAF